MELLEYEVAEEGKKSTQGKEENKGRVKNVKMEFHALITTGCDYFSIYCFVCFCLEGGKIIVNLCNV